MKTLYTHFSFTDPSIVMRSYLYEYIEKPPYIRLHSITSQSIKAVANTVTYLSRVAR